MKWVFLPCCLLAASAWAFDWRVSQQDWSALGALQPGEARNLPAASTRDTRGQLVFEAIEHRAPGARVWVMENGEPRLVPDGGHRVLRGRDPARPDWQFVLVLTAAGDLASGAFYGDAGMQALRAYAVDPGREIRLRAFDVDVLLPDGVTTDFQCGNQQLRSVAGYELPMASPAQASDASRSGGLRLGVLAIDTDKEWLERRFSNNTTAAANWIVELMAVSNLIFERDVNLRMLQGETILRVGSDPYSVTSSPASPDGLQEFGTWWQNNQGAVPRTHAALISGRSSAANSASGIAWVNSFCQTQASGGSYSLNQLFRNANIGVASSALVFAHEIGHNLGSEHTHCFSPPVDQCFNEEPGCYSGPVSCPAGGAGTLMSYCDFPPPAGAGCAANRLELHPTVANRINAWIEQNYPNCITDLVDPGLVFSDRFEQ